MFKNYENEYEKVFTNSERMYKKFNIEDVTVYNNIPLNVTMYARQFRDEMAQYEIDTFNHLVKISWLMRRFCYKGRRRIFHMTNGYQLDAAYGIFVRNFVGFDTKFLLRDRSSIAKVITYFDDFFINFDEGNPFEEKYEYPYKNVTLTHLALVYQMEYRMDLLAYAEKNNLGITFFMDYIINYINCHNDEVGKTEYEFIFSNRFIPYVKKMI